MIAVDTNVLLRHVLQDDEQQSPLATRLIEQHGKVLVTDVVLIEQGENLNCRTLPIP